MKLFSTLILALLVSKFAYAQNAPQGGVRPQSSSPATSIASATQGMKKYEGYFNFYFDEKNVRIFLEIDKLDQEFLYVNGSPAGTSRNSNGGFRIAKFTKLANKIVMVLPNYDYRAISTNPDEKKA